MKLSLGPIQYHWPRDTVFAFYRAVVLAPIDIVYLGETVCSRRHELDLDDWIDLAHTLTLAGKRVVLSTPALVETDSQLKRLRRIVDDCRYAVEANDMAAVHLLDGQRFIAGRGLNIYNPETLQLMADAGCVRWVAPIELSQAVLADMQRERPADVETEFFVHGRLPLAHSNRCFTAARFNLSDENCGYRCLDFPEGLPARTRELRPFLVLNGPQTQSASICNLIRYVPALAEVGVEVIRMSPPYANVIEIAEAFRQVIDRPEAVDAAANELARITFATTCDGYWHGGPGMQQTQPAIRQAPWAENENLPQQ